MDYFLMDQPYAKQNSMLANTVDPVIAQFETPTLNFVSDLLKRILDYQDEIENTEKRDQMRGSKYIQSDLNDTFNEVKADLSAGRKVLFSGTSCQVVGLHGFLGKDSNNLFCVDIVCHGVPSLKIWQEYLKWQEIKNDSKCVEVDFRNKRDYGWAAHVETLIFEKNGQRKQVNSEVFKKLFYGHSILRPCCYLCPYKSLNTLGTLQLQITGGLIKQHRDLMIIKVSH